ncbi:carbohydrate ABC transporter permease [Streptosporangium subroseum]|uniref:carbohydrate ABC transporter permease n=1 Tax=Streptosporangium subroseum TaxID=106412 RepID=UPI00308903C3|nr:sugar ABC transporter permease [Streptosporangium subroseum]
MTGPKAPGGTGLAPVPPGRPTAPVTRQAKPGSLRRSEARTGLGLIAPTVIIVIAVVVLPILWSISLAFQRVRLINLRSAGIFGQYSLHNFENVFSTPGFLDSLLTTLAYSVLGTASSIALGVVASLALRRKFRARGFVRSVMLLPYVAPVVAVTFVWQTMLSPQFGVINYWGQHLLGWSKPIAFLSEKSNEVSFLGLHIPVPTALLTVIAFEAWRQFPFAFLFLTARMQAIPASLEEAAMMDGATISQRFRYIVWPQLLPTIAVLSVLRFIWTFTSFDDIYLLTGGGAGTEVISVRVYNFLTGRGDIGLASAQALIIALVLAVMVGVYMKFFARREGDLS